MPFQVEVKGRESGGTIALEPEARDLPRPSQRGKLEYNS